MSFTEQFKELSLPLYGVRLPSFKIEHQYKKSLNLPDKASNYDFLKALCLEGLEKLKAKHPSADYTEYFERVNRELDTLKELDFVDYILLVWMVIKHCNENDIPVGRGRGCFLPGQTVDLDNAEKKDIESIDIGDHVIDSFGRTETVDDIFMYDVDEDIVELEFDNGSIVKCTPDHKILTYNRGWVMAERLKKTDTICCLAEK